MKERLRQMYLSIVHYSKSQSLVALNYILSLYSPEDLQQLKPVGQLLDEKNSLLNRLSVQEHDAQSVQGKLEERISTLLDDQQLLRSNLEQCIIQIGEMQTSISGLEERLKNKDGELSNLYLLYQQMRAAQVKWGEELDDRVRVFLESRTLILATDKKIGRYLYLNPTGHILTMDPALRTELSLTEADFEKQSHHAQDLFGKEIFDNLVLNANRLKDFDQSQALQYDVDITLPGGKHIRRFMVMDRIMYHDRTIGYVIGMRKSVNFLNYKPFHSKVYKPIGIDAAFFKVLVDTSLASIKYSEHAFAVDLSLLRDTEGNQISELPEEIVHYFRRFSERMGNRFTVYGVHQNDILYSQLVSGGVPSFAIDVPESFQPNAYRLPRLDPAFDVGM